MKKIIRDLVKWNICLVILLTLLLSACNLPFGSSATPAVEVPLATLELPPTPTLQPFVPDEPTIGSTLTWFDTSTLVFVPGGKFTMGADEPEKKDFNPAHQVDVGGFWIYSTKVTREMYNLCVSLGQCTPVAANSNEPSSTLSGTALISFVTGPDGAEYALKDLPVTDVTWDQAGAYCKWTGGRLPAEAEWEKTARGGESKIQPWGDETPTCDLLNFGECGGFLSSVLDYPEGMSDYMALDMAGNAYEWVNDWYQKDYYDMSPSVSPTGPSEGEQRSVRGSSFGSDGELVPSFIRNSLEPDQHRLDVGFRCVIEDPTAFAPICEAPAVIPGDANGPQPGQSGTGSSGSSISPLLFDASSIPVNYASYCANKSANLGGANITPDFTTFEAFGKSNNCTKVIYSQGASGIAEAKYLNALQGAFPKLMQIYVGPAGTSFMYKLSVIDCKKASPPPPQDVSAICAAGYVLQPNGMCVFSGTNVQPVSMSCPGGYSYSSESQCCTQNQPQAGSQPDQYPACGPGSFFDPQKNACYYLPPSVIPFTWTTAWYQYKLGTCEEPKDSDKPSQPQPTPTFCDPATGACP